MSDLDPRMFRNELRRLSNLWADATNEEDELAWRPGIFKLAEELVEFSEAAEAKLDALREPSKELLEVGAKAMCSDLDIHLICNIGEPGACSCQPKMLSAMEAALKAIAETIDG